jgi:hypothetical protein
MTPTLLNLKIYKLKIIGFFWGVILLGFFGFALLFFGVFFWGVFIFYCFSYYEKKV